MFNAFFCIANSIWHTFCLLFFFIQFFFQRIGASIETQFTPSTLYTIYIRNGLATNACMRCLIAILARHSCKPITKKKINNKILFTNATTQIHTNTKLSFIILCFFVFLNKHISHFYFIFCWFYFCLFFHLKFLSYYWNLRKNKKKKNSTHANPFIFSCLWAIFPKFVEKKISECRFLVCFEHPERSLTKKKIKIFIHFI